MARNVSASRGTPCRFLPGQRLDGRLTAVGAGNEVRVPRAVGIWIVIRGWRVAGESIAAGTSDPLIGFGIGLGRGAEIVKGNRGVYFIVVVGTAGVDDWVDALGVEDRADEFIGPGTE